MKTTQVKILFVAVAAIGFTSASAQLSTGITSTTKAAVGASASTTAVQSAVQSSVGTAKAATQTAVIKTTAVAAQNAAAVKGTARAASATQVKAQTGVQTDIKSNGNASSNAITLQQVSLPMQALMLTLMFRLNKP